MNATVCACDFAQACPDIVKANLNDKPPNIKIANDVISSIRISIQSLLTDPNPDDPLRSDVANLYQNNKIEYDLNAREYTYKYAMN